MPTLAVVPSLPVNFQAPDKVLLTHKFVDGMTKYARLWEGPVMAVMNPSTVTVTGNMDDALFNVADLPFSVRAARFGSPEFYDSLDPADIVMLGGDQRLEELTNWCARHGKKSVYVTEYSLKTRLQIINAEFRNPLVRLRKYLWEWQQERRNQRSVAIADATQCNGLPTFDRYRKINPNTLLFLDSRIAENMLADPEALAARHTTLRNGAPLRLAFSGRLSPMKGADDLIDVARELNSLDVKFTLDIFGDGPLLEFIAKEIERDALGECVRLHGVVDFATELMPYVRDQVDLFVCCHRQGDPSCTYLETMACGVPVIGYANEALNGLIRNRPTGWTTPLNRPRRLAREIATLDRQRQRLIKASETAPHLTRRHTFDAEFAARVDQIRQLTA